MIDKNEIKKTKDFITISYKNFVIVNEKFEFLKDMTSNDIGKIYRIFYLLKNKNNCIGKSYSLMKYLKFNNCEVYRRFIRRIIEKNVIKEIKDYNNENFIILNPIYAKSSNFILTKEVLELFYDDIVKNIDFIIDNIQDINVLNSLKEYIPSFEYIKLSFKLNPNERYKVFDYPISDSGVYLLYKDSEIIYIGKSNNIKKRIYQHNADKCFTSVKSIMFKNFGDINLYEPYLIQKYKPVYNKDLLENASIDLPDIEIK